MFKDKRFLEHFDLVIKLSDKQSEEITGGRFYDFNIMDDRGNIWGLAYESVPNCNFYHNSYRILEINKALTSASKKGAGLLIDNLHPKTMKYEDLVKQSREEAAWESYVRKVCKSS